MAVSLEQASRLVQHETRVRDTSGSVLGRLAQVYVDERTDLPLWIALVLDAPSTLETVAPVHDAHVWAGELVLNYPRTLVEAAPRVAAGDELPWVEEERLRDHYGRHAPSADRTRLVPLDELDGRT